jgi:hypothetical protein
MGAQYTGYDDEAIDALQALSDEIADLKYQLENAREVAHSFRRRLEQAQVENARLRAGKEPVTVNTDVLEFVKDNDTKHVLKYKGGKSSGYFWTCTCGAGEGLRYTDRDVRTWEAVEHIASTLA